MASFAASSELTEPISGIIKVLVSLRHEGWKKRSNGTCDDDGVVLTPDMDVGIGHFVQACDVGALRSDDAREAGAIGKRKETDVGGRLGLFDRVPDGVFGLVDARLVAGLQGPRRFAILGVGVIFDHLPVSLRDGIFGIVDARRRRCRRRGRGTGGHGRLGRLRGRLGFDAEMAKGAEDRALRRYGVVILQWDGDRVRYGLRRGGISNLRLQRRGCDCQLDQI
jgi:hypothetical protein